MPDRLSRAAVVLVLLVAACGDDTTIATPGTTSTTTSTTSVATTTPSTTTTTEAADQCTGFEMGTSDAQGVIATTATDLDVYCLTVPPGTGRLIIDLTGMSVDLDLYVELVSTVGGEAWSSILEETADEQVIIDDPQPGVYQITVESFTGEPSTFSLLFQTVAAGDVTTTTAVLATDCDPPAQPIALGQTVDSEIQASTQPYPANATYYCLQVPAGVGRVTIELTGLLADLDLYVGFGTIDSVQGVEPVQGESYDWRSNAFGTVDERIVINAPEPGLYYIEIVSFNQEFSPFTLAVSD